jgi:hypothetical protein
MSSQPYPIQLVTDDDLTRSRVTVFFRSLLVIPHFVVLALYGIAVWFVALIAWVAALFLGRVPEGMHSFIAGYLRYSTRVSAYLFLLADPYPPFGSGGSYPVDLEIDPPERQGRLGVFFRSLLLFPCLALSGVLGYAMLLVAIGCWWVAMFTGRVPGGLVALGRYSLRFSARVNAYHLLLTSRYPALGDPFAAAPAAPRTPQGSLPADATALPPLP